MNWRATRFDLKRCVEETIGLLAPRAREKNLTLTHTIEPSIPRYIATDETRLRQVLVNVVSNAIKFTDEGGVVLSIAGSDDDPTKLQFSVRDTGIGIAKEDQHLLFQSFSQVDSSNTRRYEGTGLGLVICKRLCNLMGGRIWVESTLGVGSTFHFTITVDPVDESQVGLAETSQGPLYRRRLLIVCDDESERQNITAYVQSWGMIQPIFRLRLAY